MTRSAKPRTIAQRELRNESGAVLARVQRGERMRVTVRGKPVADLVPVSTRRAYLPREELVDLLTALPRLDWRSFVRDVRAATKNVDRF